jgi:hypothetical protein
VSLLIQELVVSFKPDHSFTEVEVELVRSAAKHSRQVQNNFVAENDRNREGLSSYLQEYGLSCKAMSKDLRGLTPWGLMEFNL